MPPKLDSDWRILLLAFPAFVAAGLISAEQLDRTLVEMRRLATDGTVLAVMPRMTQVWARKPARRPPP